MRLFLCRHNSIMLIVISLVLVPYSSQIIMSSASFLLKVQISPLNKGVSTFQTVKHWLKVSEHIFEMLECIWYHFARLMIANLAVILTISVIADISNCNGTTSDVDVTIGCYQGDYSSWDNVELRMLM